MRRPVGFGSRPFYQGYLIFVLATVFALNGLDATALSLVLQNIKAALHVTDTELGFLTGIAFSLFYSTVGIPIGRWADRGDRVAIIALTTTLWGVMVMLVGATRTFAQLLLVRIGVAVGEAGCIPAAYSLIGEYFSRKERPKAVAKYMLGGCASVLLGYPAAGWLSQNYGWRLMFVCLGLPSIVIAPLVWWTLSESRRRKQSSLSRADEAPTGILRLIPVLWRNRTFRFLLATQCVIYFFAYGIGIWEASFFVRSYGMKVQELGLFFALIYGLGAIIGNYTGGYLASRYAADNETLQLRTLALVNVVFGALSACVYLSKNPFISLVLLGLAVVGGTLQNGPVFATAQTVIPERMRATSIAVIYFFSNMFGAGLGPLSVGALSDALHPYLGPESLRYALLVMCPGYLVNSWLLSKAARSVVADTDAIASGGESARRRECYEA